MTAISTPLRLLFSRAGHYLSDQPMLYAEGLSPKTPQHACPHCYEVTEASMVPDSTRTIREPAIATWPTAWQGHKLRNILATLGHDVDVPRHTLPQKLRHWILSTQENSTMPAYIG